MPEWPKERRIIGTAVPRVDGALKVTGKAKYSYDRVFPGLLHAKILRSPHAHAKIRSLDLSAAEKMPGVKAVHVIKNAGAELRFVGDEIAAVAAETEEQARDAARAIRVEYEVLPHAVTEEDGRKNVTEAPQEQKAGDVEAALRGAAAAIEGTYGSPVITHLCLETHGLVAQWRSEKEFVVYCSTQNVSGVGRDLKGRFRDMPDLKVVCETPFMGGGFGSKFAAGVEGEVAVQLSRKTRRPVKLMLEREEEQIAGGNRPSLFARVKAGADAQGKLVAFDADCWGTGGYSGGLGQRLPYIYAPQTRRVRTLPIPTNCDRQRAWRAPGSPQASVIMEQAMDDLADKLGIDPVEFRIKNLPDNNLKPIYERELKLGAERIGWARRHKRGDETPGPLKRGLGCALSTWGGRAHDSQATTTLHPDGRVEVRCGTQDLGTGTTTLVPLVAAEILGLEVKDVTPLIGTSDYPPSGASGGSTTCGGVSLSVAMSAKKALEELFKKVAPELGADPKDLQAQGKRVFVRGNPQKGLSWKQACALLGQQPVTAAGSRAEAPAGMSSEGVGGAQFADVTVDVETGVVRINKIVAVADCGMVMNRLLCESQVYGGVVMGVCHGLFEERRMDPRTGRMLNPDMEWYKVAGHSDLGEIEVHLLDYPERGVIGIGEPPVIPTAAAIANAVANAIGVRAGIVPLTPRRVLEALAAK
ncbi:MAG TPA: xanthine dehydrogenase family protein molybdopterin-binding subunit [Planctomycetota bacterium]|nr:xanthine dehydrogenase family protein molybdopterin-binding subunit [Planctomycetota bacterium]